MNVHKRPTYLILLESIQNMAHWVNIIKPSKGQNEIIIKSLDLYFLLPGAWAAAAAKQAAVDTASDKIAVDKGWQWVVGQAAMDAATEDEAAAARQKWVKQQQRRQQ